MIALVVATGGCTRARPAPSPSPGGPGAAIVPVAAPTAAIALIAPAAGGTITSPVPVVASANLAAGQSLAAQIYSRAADGGLTWRGNGRLTAGGGSQFSGTVTYTLPAPSPGILELVVVDTLGSRIVERQSTEVSLAAAP